MDVFECVSTLSSIRSFLDREVQDELIYKILEAGRLAPSAHNDQPWEFLLVKNKDIIKNLKKFCLSGSFVAHSAFTIVVLIDRYSRWKEIDTTRAVQNMVLTAWSFNLGTCWIGRLDMEGLIKYLNIPEKWDVLTVLPFGYFNENMLPGHKIRKHPDKVFHLDKYGNRLK